MAEPLVPDDLWEAIAPLLPRHKARVLVQREQELGLRERSEG
jgi:hypothetical protein